tara:strand:- start:332 stop:1081 length:750 start_codon:yes stop_codon:yes gene_type:complete
MTTEKNNFSNVTDYGQIFSNQSFDPNAQLNGAGVTWKDEEHEDGGSDFEGYNANPNKFSLMLNEISKSDSYPIFIENPKADYSDFDSDLVSICNILAEVSPRVTSGKEIYALRTMIGYGFYTITKPKEVSARQLVSEIDSMLSGINTMLPWLNLKPAKNKSERRNIAYIGSGNMRIHEELTKEIPKFLNPNCWSTSILGSEEIETAKYFMLVSLTPAELCRANGLSVKDSSVKELIRSIQGRNKKLTEV